MEWPCKFLPPAKLHYIEIDKMLSFEKLQLLHIFHRNQLYKWQEQIDARGADAFPGKGRLSGKDDELAKLKREIDRLKEENEILKKAARYFARESE